MGGHEGGEDRRQGKEQEQEQEQDQGDSGCVVGEWVREVDSTTDATPKIKNATNVQAIFRFTFRPEFLIPGTPLILLDSGNTKGIGRVVKML
jgi:hypothetical protein